ncbi:MAG: sulfatase-like hydrolase/transferase [Planctomycetota bacterium]
MPPTQGDRRYRVAGPAGAFARIGVEAVAIVAIVAIVGSVSNGTPPNLIVILTDDQGYADVGFNGCKDIPTPKIDRIAREGVRCTSGYVTHSVCGPSRAALITGRYQCRFGASRNPTVDPTVPNNGVPREQKNLAELLAPRGYRSMAIGKWHLGTHPDLRPLVRGFDEFFGFLSGGHNYFAHQLTLNDLSEVDRPWAWYRTKLLRGEKRVEIDDYLTDELSDAAVDFIDRSHEQPFFLYLAYNAPHSPLQATDEYLSRFASIEDKDRRTYAAMVSAVDDGVGRVLDAVTRHALDEQTLIFFLSDNGGPPSNASSNAPLRGHKSSPFEGGVRVPFAVRWIGTLPKGHDYDHAVSSLDIAATMVAHADVEVPTDRPLDGVDLVPYLTGEEATKPHPVLFWRWYDSHRLAARIDDDKFILLPPEDRYASDGPRLLYDLGSDIGERQNLATTRPAVFDHAKQQALQWNRELVPPAYPGLGTWMPGQ